MNRELYIYWKLRPGQEVQALAAAAAMQQSLRSQHPGLVTRLLRRSDTSATQTLMEVYSRPASGVDGALEESIAAAARSLEPCVAPQNGSPGVRHVEIFESVPISAEP